MTERDIAEAIGRAGFGLRFDRTAVRVVGALQDGLGASVPENATALFTITAPIKRPAKTTAEMKSLALIGLRGGYSGSVIHGNDVRFRLVRGVPANGPRAIGFVHNPGSDGEHLLDLAQTFLTGSKVPISHASKSG